MRLPGNWAVSVMLQKESRFCGRLLFRWFFLPAFRAWWVGGGFFVWFLEFS